VSATTPRPETQRQRQYCFGAFTLDLDSGFLRRAGDVVELRPRAFEVLVYLVERHGKLVAKDELASAVWAGLVVTDNSVAQCITEIRRALGDDDQKTIRTVARRGYVFAAPVAAPVRVLPRAVPLEDTPAATAVTRSPLLPRLAQRRSVIAALLVLLAAGGLWWQLSPNGAEALRDAPLIDAAPANTLAVLPFQPLDAAERDDPLGIGMADSLITRLGLLRDLSVRPFASVQLYADGSKDPQAAGRELKVSSVLEGTLQKDGDRIRIRARLYRVSDGRLLWAEQFDEPYRDLFALQDSISERVAAALSFELRLKLTSSVAPEAWEDYVRGRYFFELFTREGNEKALEYFERALELEPAFALAHAGLALNYGVMLERGFVSAAQGAARHRQAAERALALDDSLAEAHAAIATVHMEAFDWAEAERSYRRAIELNPSYLHAWGFYAHLLAILDRDEEALVLLERAMEIDPVSDYASKGLANGLMRLGRYDEAVVQVQRALELRPDFQPALNVLAETYLRMGRLDDARRGFVAAKNRAGAAYVEALQGKPLDAEKLIAEIRDVPSSPSPSNAASTASCSTYCLSSISRAELQTVLGDTKGALASLDKSYDERAAGLKLLNVNPRLAPLRGEPRFERLLDRLNL
jgi:DNA-binding winged helix-turn-helix (wHTH) protein/TolB-like protein/Tfp pilus assembly protein PilF